MVKIHVRDLGSSSNPPNSVTVATRTRNMKLPHWELHEVSINMPPDSSIMATKTYSQGSRNKKTDRWWDKILLQLTKYIYFYINYNIFYVRL